MSNNLSKPKYQKHSPGSLWRHLSFRKKATILNFTFIIISVFLCFSSLIVGQNISLIDSLTEAYKVAQSDSIKVSLLNELSWQTKNHRPNDAIGYASEALEIAKEKKLYSGQATALNRLGAIRKIENQYREAEQHYLEALAIERSIDHKFGVARALNQLSIVYRALAKFDTALVCGKESLVLFEELKTAPHIASAHNALAQIYISVGDYASAITSMNLGLKIREEIAKPSQIALSINSLGQLYLNQKDYSAALRHFKRALEIWESEGNKAARSRSHTNLAATYYYLSDYTQAISHNLSSIRLKESIGAEYKRDVNYNNLGAIYEELDQLDSAAIYYSLSESIKRSIQDSIGIAALMNNQGNLLYKQERYLSAFYKYAEGIRYGEALGTKIILLDLYKGAADAKSKLGDLSSFSFYNELYLGVRDSLDEAYRRSVIVQKELTEERAKNAKLEEQNRLAMEKERANILQLYFLIAALLLLALLFFLAQRNHKLRQQALISEGKEKESNRRINELIQKQEIKSMSAMIDGQEGERKRIAQDLHDRLGSTLSMVKIHFQSVEEYLQQIKDYNKEQYEKANKLLDQACEEVRKVAHDMVSGVLNKFGLVPALNSLAESVNDTGQLNLEVLPFGFDENRMVYDVEINIYRIIQELLANTLKHAKAKEMSIQLIKKEDTLNVVVEDDGVGFDPDSIASKEGIGLKNIEARVDKLNGELMIDSGQGAGTTVTLEIPLT